MHGAIYGYSKVNYITNNKKVEIVCKLHGSFFHTPQYHLRGYKCPLCTKQINKIKTADFVNKANQVHENRYNYDKVIYEKAKNKVIITCLIHGDFLQTPDGHLRGSGCPTCKCSKGELKIIKFLKDNKVNYISQYV